MKFNKNMSIYRNDNLQINDESIIGQVKDITEYIQYNLASYLMGFNELDEIISNLDITKEILVKLTNYNNDRLIELTVNTMGVYVGILNEK